MLYYTINAQLINYKHIYIYNKLYYLKKCLKLLKA